MTALTPDLAIERLSRFLFSAPSWGRSLAIVIVLGLVIDGVGFRTGNELALLGSLGFTLPALFAFLATPALVAVSGKSTTWNRSALLALSCTVIGVIATLSPILFIARDLLPILYALALGMIFGIRILMLVAVADYRISRMILPAFSQSAVGLLVGVHFFDLPFLGYALLFQVLFGIFFTLLVWMIERPVKKAYQISGLHFLNAFIAHLTDGSKSIEEFFREIGEEVYVPQANLFFRREEGRDLIFTVPNVHPGPMGEVGGGNLPRILHESFEEEVMVAHGCATHDFNLVSESEIAKIARAVRDSMDGIRYTRMASRSNRVACGSVQVLYQRFGDSLLMVGTRSPERTEDLDFSLGMIIMAEGRRHFSHVAFVDAHNCMTEIGSSVMPGTRIATEYLCAAKQGMAEARLLPLDPLQIGIAHVRVPFTREQGFGTLGIQALVTGVAGQRTAYVLLDGNNIASGARERLLEAVLAMVDEGEVMTSDTHTVNTVSGANPIGLAVPVEDILPYVEKAVSEALEDLSPARVSATTACCERIIVFGSQSVSRLASTVNAVISFIAPVSLTLLALAFVLSVMAYVMLQ